MAKRNQILKQKVTGNHNFPKEFVTTFEKDSLFALLGFAIITQFSAYEDCRGFFDLLKKRIEYARNEGLEVNEISEIIEQNFKAGSEKIFEFKVKEVNDHHVRIIMNFFREFVCLVSRTAILKDRLQNGYPIPSDLNWTMLKRICDVFHFALGYWEYGQEPKFYSENKEREFPLIFLTRKRDRKYSLLLHRNIKEKQSFKAFYPVLVNEKTFEEAKYELIYFYQIKLNCY